MFNINNVTVEKLTKTHVDELAKLEDECFSIPWSKNAFYEELANKMAIYFVAIYEGKIIAYAGMWHVVTEGHITNVAVSPEYRRNGVGELLLNELIKIAEEKEMIGLTLEVNMNNFGAQKLYLKHGFKVEGIRKNYYADTHEDAVIMWKMMNYEG